MTALGWVLWVLALTLAIADLYLVRLGYILRPLLHVTRIVTLSTACHLWIAVVVFAALPFFKLHLLWVLPLCGLLLRFT